MQQDINLTVRSQDKPKTAVKALMSPRLSVFADQGTWDLVQRSRHDALDRIAAASGWLDLRFLAALGEPCYWSYTLKGEPLQDDGASRFEMQPRNQGSEFVGTRLRKLAATVAQRDAAKVLAGLTGQSVDDELGDNSPGSRTATGLAGPGPTDNALAWCALWGISQFPLAMRINDTAETSGHFSRGR